MIKCSGFGKLLKQYFIISLISFFGLLVGCFASASYDLSQNMYVRQNGDYGFSPYNSDFDVNVVSKGNLLTQRIGMTTKSIYLSPGTYMVWQYSDNLGGVFPYLSYTLSDSRTPWNYQGFPTHYALCDEFDGNNHISDYNLSNCTVYAMNSASKNTIVNFMSTITNYDTFGFNYLNEIFTSETQYNQGGVLYCFSSSQLHKSICFGISKWNNRGANGFTIYPGFDNYHNQNNYTGYGITLPSNYDELYNTYLYSSPGAVGGTSISGGSQDVVQAPITGNTMYTKCSKGLAFKWYRANGYKSRMCYTSRSNTNEIFNGSPANYVENFVLTGVDFDELYIDTANLYRFGNTGAIMSEINWFDYWRKTYEVYKKNQGNVNNPFNGVPVALFTFMGNVDSYGLPYNSASILEFCNLSLYTLDYSVPYTGIVSSRVCTMSAIDFLDIELANEENPDDGFPGDGNTDGTVGDIGSSWVGITDRPGHYSKPGSSGNDLQLGSTGYQNGKSFMNNFFNSITENFRFPEGQYPGVLPSYIIIVFCGIILFRFLSH